MRSPRLWRRMALKAAGGNTEPSGIHGGLTTLSSLFASPSHGVWEGGTWSSSFSYISVSSFEFMPIVLIFRKTHGPLAHTNRLHKHSSDSRGSGYADQDVRLRRIGIEDTFGR